MLTFFQAPLIMKKIYTLLFVLTAAAGFAQSDGFSDIFATTGAGTGVWSDPNDWTALLATDDPCCGGDGIPDGDDFVIINHTIACNSDQNFGYMEVNHDGTSASTLVNLTIATGVTLTGINGIYAGNALIIGNGSTTRIARITTNGTIVTRGLQLTAAGTSGRAFCFVQNGGTCRIIGDLTYSAALATYAQMNGAVGSGNTIELTGAISGTTGRFFGGSGTQSTFVYNGSSDQVVRLKDLNITYANLTIDNSDTVTIDTSFNNTNMNGKFLIESGSTFDQESREHVFEDSVTNEGTWLAGADITTTGAFTNTGTYTSTGSNVTVGGNWSNSGTYTHSDGDSVTLNGTAAQTITGTTTFSYLVLENTAGTAADVTFPSGTVNIESVLDINNCNVDNTGATVTLLSTGTETARMIDMGTGSYDGNLTVQRQVANSTAGYRELTSPVAGTVLDDWEDDGVVMSGFPNSDFPSFGFVSVYTYDESTSGGVKDNGWVEATDASSDATGPSAGHRVYMDDATFNISVTGTPNQGTQNIAVTNSFLPATDEDGWNLIGNPYPCGLNWNSLSAADKSAVDDVIYTFNATAGNYGVYIGGEATGTNDVDSVIASGQGFWVHATSASGNVVINEEDKIDLDKDFVRSAASLPQNWMKVKMWSNMNTYRDEAVLMVSEGSSENFEPGKDYFKFYSDLLTEVPSLAWVSADNYDLVYSKVPESASSIKLKAFAGNSALGTYTLDFENIEAFAPTSCVTLEDLETGHTQDLRTNPSYTYTVLSSDASAPRFVIHVDVQYDIAATPASCYASTDGQIEVSHNGSSSYVVSWFDETGAAMGSTVVGSPTHTIAGLLPGTYGVKVSGACTTPGHQVEITAPDEIIADFSVSSVLEEGQVLDLANLSTGAVHFSWDMGDGTVYSAVEPMHSYAAAGDYTITLTAGDVTTAGCSDVKTFDVEVTPASVGLEELESGISAYVTDQMLAISNSDGLMINRIELLDLNGKLVTSRSINVSSNTTVPLNKVADGMYLVKVYTEKGINTIKIRI